MNTAFKSLTAAMLLLGSANAFAEGSSIELKVQGTIVPSACEPVLSTTTVDYGKISFQDLNDDTTYDLPHKTVDLTVTCEAAALVALQVEDNDKNPYEVGEKYFGLGLNGTQKIGDMTLQLSSMVVDDGDGTVQQAIPIVSSDEGETWSAVNADYLMHGNFITAPAVGTGNAPIPTKVWTSVMNIQARLAPAEDLTVNEDVPFLGSVTISMVYL